MHTFGTTSEGLTVHLFTLENKNGIAVSITNYGGIVTAIRTPDRGGNFANIVLGFEQFQSYLSDHPFFGALIGRYANRISNSSFVLNGKTYSLAANVGPNHLHGGKRGFDKVVWDFDNPNNQTLKLSYLSKDGEEGYPGNLEVVVTYTLNDRNELKIAYQAQSDKDTPVNLTNHSYFNLTGNPGQRILDHVLQIQADSYTPVDDTSIPTGEIASVTATPFDFRSPKTIGRDMHSLTNGYDHNFVLGDKIAESPKPVAEVYDPASGRKLQAETDKPGMQLYTGGGITSDIGDPEGIPFQKFSGLCLETQFFPDSPNQNHFPSPVLKAGNLYKTTTIYRFSNE